MKKEFDVRSNVSVSRPSKEQSQIEALAVSVSDSLPGTHRVQVASMDGITGNPSRIVSSNAEAIKGNYVQRAVEHLQQIRPALGLREHQPAEFQADPHVQTTSSGAVTVYLQQLYKGLPIFQATEAVRFDVSGALAETAGHVVGVDQDKDPVPSVGPADAVRIAASHVTEAPQDEATLTDPFGEPMSAEPVDLTSFEPAVVATYPSTVQQSVILEPGPFGDKIKAALTWFYTGDDLRLAWEVLITMPDFAGQYRTLVDAESGDILYCRQLMCSAIGHGTVYEVDGSSARQAKTMPQPLEAYGLPIPSDLPPEFADDWIFDSQTVGNSTYARLGAAGPALVGQSNGDEVVFDPADPVGDDQKVLNIFYYNGYMHDFFYLLGFREVDGNFQSNNYGRGGYASDPVDARAHSGPVWGTANMATPADGWSPIMNMGLVTSTGNHTAFDSSVVYHEFTHGVTNRLVGGRLNDHALEQPQSGGMGEGWGDYFACSINDTEVVGDWVVGSAGGIRGFPYDTNFPDGFGDLGTGRYTGVHAIGEIWCATLMEINRQIGKPLTLQLVVDALKLSPANPGFLDMRDAILTALDDKRASGGITADEYEGAYRGAWTAFAKFGMGPNAQSSGATLSGIVPDHSLPPEAEVDTDTSVTGESSPDAEIPDPTPGRQVDSISIEEEGIVQSVAVSVDIGHSYTGDLRIMIESPSGTVATLLDPSGAPGEDVQATYTADTAADLALFTGEASQGDWKLIIEDTQPGDIGRLRSWNVDVDFAEGVPSLRQEAPEGFSSDRGSVATSMPISFSGQGQASQVRVGYGIRHEHAEDLKIALVPPSGRQAIIRNRQPAEKSTIAERHTSGNSPTLATLLGEPIQGEWYLRLTDRAGRCEPKLDGWSLELGVQEPVAGQTATEQPLARFDEANINAGFEELDTLARSEYSQSIAEILDDADPAADLGEKRLARLVGVLLKRKFAHSKETIHSDTKAKFRWEWNEAEDWERALADPANADYTALLTELKDFNWAESGSGDDRNAWAWFKDQVETERGLFKILAMWLDTRRNDGPAMTIHEMLEARESPELEFKLDVADMAGQMAIASALAPFIPVPGMAVGLGLIVSKYGYRRIREWATNEDVNMPDASS